MPWFGRVAVPTGSAGRSKVLGTCRQQQTGKMPRSANTIAHRLSDPKVVRARGLWHRTLMSSPSCPAAFDGQRPQVCRDFEAAGEAAQNCGLPEGHSRVYCGLPEGNRHMGFLAAFDGKMPQDCKNVEAAGAKMA